MSTRLTNEPNQPRDQINKLRNKKANITTNMEEVKKTIRRHFENLYSSEIENLKNG